MWNQWVDLRGRVGWGGWVGMCESGPGGVEAS